MNKLPFVFCLTVLFSHNLFPITLTSSKGLIDRFIDGHSFGVDGKVFGLMLKIRRDLKSIIHGNQQKEGYIFNQKKYTLEELVLLEEEYLTNNQTKQLDILMSSCLPVVKKDLDSHLTKYAELAKGVKQYLLIFIKESCEKHRRKSSILQNWAQVKEGHESEQLERAVVDFKIAYQFCLDLIHFLEDMCDSCPKAQEQFKVLLKTTKN